MKRKTIEPTHPGEVLLEEFLKPLGISQYRLAKSIFVSTRRVNEIVLRRRGISADMALRLGRFFGTSAEFWMNLQTGFEMEVAMRGKGARDLGAIVPITDPRRTFAPSPSPAPGAPATRGGEITFFGLSNMRTLQGKEKTEIAP